MPKTKSTKNETFAEASKRVEEDRSARREASSRKATKPKSTKTAKRETMAPLVAKRPVEATPVPRTTELPADVLESLDAIRRCEGSVREILASVFQRYADELDLLERTLEKIGWEDPLMLVRTVAYELDMEAGWLRRPNGPTHGYSCGREDGSIAAVVAESARDMIEHDGKDHGAKGLEVIAEARDAVAEALDVLANARDSAINSTPDSWHPASTLEQLRASTREMRAIDAKHAAALAGRA